MIVDCKKGTHKWVYRFEPNTTDWVKVCTDCNEQDKTFLPPDCATERQMSLLRKLYYKSKLLTYESYATFDDTNRKLLSKFDAITLIEYGKTRYDIYLEHAKQIIKNLEEKL